MPFSVLGRGGGCLLAAFVHRQGVKSREFVFRSQRRRERGTEGVRKEVEMVQVIGIAVENVQCSGAGDGPFEASGNWSLNSCKSPQLHQPRSGLRRIQLEQLQIRHDINHVPAVDEIQSWIYKELGISSKYSSRSTLNSISFSIK